MKTCTCLLSQSVHAHLSEKKKKKKKKWSSPFDTSRLGENTKGDMAHTKPTTAKRNLYGASPLIILQGNIP